MPNSISEQELFKLINGLHLDSERVQVESASTKSGKASWIQIENNEIKHHFEEGSPLPVIKALPPVVLLKNGSVVTGTTTVTKNDQLEWRIEPAPLYILTIAEDRLNVWFELISKHRYRMRLRDTEKSNEITLEAEEERSQITETVAVTGVIHALQNKGIIYFDADAIKREVLNPTHLPVVVAKGEPPKPGKDAEIELFFKENIESSFEEVNGLVDFRNHLKIPCAKTGDVVAKKIPMKEGSNGYDVFGNVLETPKPKDIILVAKNNVRMNANGEVIALSEGRPRVTGDKIKFIDITSSYVVPGDVDLRTGNIVFSGDVVIYGDVQDDMIVEALGDIYVMGSVYRATITATGSIYIKGNIIGSKLYSGHYGVLFNRLYSHTKHLNEQIANLRNALKQLIQVVELKQQTVPAHQAYQLLLETKFRGIVSTAKEILVCISNIQITQKDLLQDLKVKINEFLRPPITWGQEISSFLMQMQHLLIETFESVKRCEETNAVCDISQCQLTIIMANGDILVRHDGVLQSELYSKNNIVFYGKDAVCRGSKLEAEQMISATYVASPSGGESCLKAGKKIMVQKMYGGRVIVGKFSKELLDSVENTTFLVNNNSLVIEKV